MFTYYYSIIITTPSTTKWTYTDNISVTYSTTRHTTGQLGVGVGWGILLCKVTNLVSTTTTKILFAGYEECMVPVSNSLARVLSSGHLSPEFLITSALPSVLGFLWPGCGSWPDDKQQLHVSVLSCLADGLRSLLLLFDTQ